VRANGESGGYRETLGGAVTLLLVRVHEDARVGALRSLFVAVGDISKFFSLVRSNRFRVLLG
jgi:hypothetical protein